MVSLTLFNIGERSDPIRHDTTRPDPIIPPFFTPPLLSCRVPFHSVLLNERLEKVSDNNRN